MPSTFAFPPPATPSLRILGSEARFPVRRIYCVGQNYAAHAREMGGDPDRTPPFFFSKPGDALVPGGGKIPYPSKTANFHHEVELVVALERGGMNIDAKEALEHVFGYAVGIDLTRRDLQNDAREKKQPWDASKGFDRSAPCGTLHPVSEVDHLSSGAIWFKVNGEMRQSSDISDLIWSVPNIIAFLSQLFELAPGDLIYTGTPAGVGPLQRGDHGEGGIERLGTIAIDIV
ncbi:MAG TPA: fumarylacetoacetate hydrolase family protein [Rhizomicrobium sp.]|jgi:fumarylpyruvate hydrolase|nr:fumarylacetoacetate hydrolase family protein [Rhizomicrobium sp.]